MEIRKIKVDDIHIDPDLQPRAHVDHSVTADYTDDMDNGDIFPPISVFEDKGGKLWLADGFHRVYAAMRLRRATIKAEVRKGTKRDALLFSCGANATHGEHRTHKDIERVVMILLKDKTWGSKPDRWIAKKARVSHGTIAKYRNELRGTPRVETKSRLVNLPKENQSQQTPPPVPAPKKKVVKTTAPETPAKLPTKKQLKEARIAERQKSKRASRVAYQMAELAISHLGRVDLSDPYLDEELNRVKTWIENRLKEKQDSQKVN